MSPPLRALLGLALGLAFTGCIPDRAGTARAVGDGGVRAHDGGTRDAAPPSDATAGTDADAPGDAGDDDGDAGAPPLDAGPPPEVAFEVRLDGTSCPALTPCGGTLDETRWELTGGCVAFPQVNELRRACASATVSGTGTARGRVTFSGGTMRRELSATWRGAVSVPRGCAAFVGGCDGVANTVRVNVPGATVSCPADAAGDCACTVTVSPPLDDTAPYRVEGEQFVTDAPARRWSFCVTGDALRYAGASGAVEPGTFAFRRL